MSGRAQRQLGDRDLAQAAQVGRIAAEQQDHLVGDRAAGLAAQVRQRPAHRRIKAAARARVSSRASRLSSVPRAAP